MTIHRAPLPNRDFVILSNKLVRNRKISYKARGLLSYILSHTEGWSTDAESLADASDVDGRTTVSSGLKELENARYLIRRKRQIPKGDPDGRGGQWVTDSWVFDKPVPPGTDLDALIAELRKGDEDDVDPNTPDPVDEPNPQVTPETGNPQSVAPDAGFPQSVEPTSVEPTSVEPTSGNPLIKEDGFKKTKGGVRASANGARPATAQAETTPPKAKRAKSEPRPGWDEFGPLSPKCLEHKDVAGDPPCRSCRDWREKFDKAEGKRDLAARHRRTQELLQEQNRAAASRQVPTDAHASRIRADLAARRGRAGGTEGSAPDDASSLVDEPADHLAGAR